MKPTAQVNVVEEGLGNDQAVNSGATAMSFLPFRIDGAPAVPSHTSGVSTSPVEPCWKCNNGSHLSRDCPVWAAEKAAMYVDFTYLKCGIHGHYPNECYYFTMYEQEERPAGVLRLNAQPEN